jgi:hypothetical protein
MSAQKRQTKPYHARSLQRTLLASNGWYLEYELANDRTKNFPSSMISATF